MSVVSEKGRELVLCVAATAVEAACGGLPMSCGDRGLFNSVISLGPAFFKARGNCETDETLKQLIPYVVLMYRNRIYCYTRGKAGGEDRLHAKLSIGIGGHVERKDMRGNSAAYAVACASSREFCEEIGDSYYDLIRDEIFLGLINDNSDPVGRVHLGVARIFEMRDDDIEPREDAIADGQWLTIGELWEQRDRLENWSRIVVEHLRREQ